jgi:DNA-directed RNA polymerase sigma subunit (sigma70/sigma32)
MRPEVQAALTTAVQQLPLRLQAVLVAVYGLDEQPPWSRAAVGRSWGLSRERIRQLHDQALVRLAIQGTARPCTRSASGRPARPISKLCDTNALGSGGNGDEAHDRGAA